MKKVALTLASVMAAAAFAPEASAIPSFARQTGMACSACHQQHFPVLNGFGQAFKSAGYTMMGSQEKVEGEHLSIPATLNGSMLLKARYQKSDGNDAATAVSGTSTNGGQWQIPDEFSLFFGGRVAEGGALKIGFMFEGNTAGTMLVAGFKMPVVFDMDTVKVGVVPYLTDALGAFYGYDLSSTGQTRGVRWAEHRTDISAQQYVGMSTGAATGVATYARTDMGYVAVSRYAPHFTASGTAAVQLSSTILRAALTPNVAGWDMQIGVGSISGSNYGAPATTANANETKATSLDFQAFGTVADRDLAVYATWASAPASGTTAGTSNAFNSNTADAKTAMTVGADYSIIPHTLHLGAAYRNAKNGKATLNEDNSITVMAVYDLTQNVALHVNHSVRSGSSYDAGGANDATVVGSSGKALTTFLLEAAW